MKAHFAQLIRWPLALLAVAVLASSAPAQRAASGGAQPQLLGQYGDWGAYTASPGGRKICFAIAKPRSAQTNPPNRPRDPAFLFVSTRPTENVRNEISVNFGYPLRPGKPATIDIGGTSFSLYTQGDGAWIQNVAEEARHREALRRGSDVVVHGTSTRGTESTDTYSLSGVSQALDRAGQECN